MIILQPETAELASAWDAYAERHHRATAYHRMGWRRVLEKAYGLRCYYLMAVEDHGNGRPPDVRGLLPLVHIRGLIFGNKLVSMPYFDSGGVLADAPPIEARLVQEAVSLARRLGVDALELRQTEPLTESVRQPAADVAVSLFSAKARMLLKLPESPQALMAGFKSKLRSQVKNPIKKGLQTRIGGAELLDDFYRVFAVNMRDLGSPVHSKALMARTLEAFGSQARLFVVYEGAQALAASLVLAFPPCLENPWASSLREFSASNANMLLYWSMLEWACAKGFRWFNFGRSAPDEGTFRFKQQWGASPAPLNWYSFSRTAAGQPSLGHPDKAAYDRLIGIWQKFPVPLTRLVGPIIRKRISL